MSMDDFNDNNMHKNTKLQSQSQVKNFNSQATDSSPISIRENMKDEYVYQNTDLSKSSRVFLDKLYKHNRTIKSPQNNLTCITSP